MADWRDSAKAKPILLQRLDLLTRTFPECLEAYANRGPFSNDQLRAHLLALENRASHPSAKAALSDPSFAELVRNVLARWGVGSRGSRFVSNADFYAALKQLAPYVTPLNDVRIDDPHLDIDEVAERLWRLVNALNLVVKDGQPVQNRVVSGTKALHHVLPELVFPVDREYTQTFFGWRNPEFQYSPRECFRIVFLALAEVARNVDLSKYVGSGWMRSRAKLLDNAVVGFLVIHGLKSDNSAYQKRKQVRNAALVKRARELGIWNAIEAEARKKADEAVRTGRIGNRFADS